MMPDTVFILKIEIVLPDKEEKLQNLMMDEISSESVLENLEKIANAFFSAVAGEPIEAHVEMDYD